MNKKFEVNNPVKKKFEIINESTPLSSIEPITESGLKPRNREDLVRMVETPWSVPIRAVNLNIPINQNTTVGQVQNAARLLVSKFEQQ